MIHFDEDYYGIINVSHDTISDNYSILYMIPEELSEPEMKISSTDIIYSEPSRPQEETGTISTTNQGEEIQREIRQPLSK